MREDVNAVMTHGRDLGQWKDCGSSPRVQRSAHRCFAGAVIDVDDEAAIVAVGHVSSASAEIKISAADDRGQLRGLWERYEAQPGVAGVEVEPEEAGRVEAAEAAEECGVGGVPEPALGDGRGADEAGGEVEAEEDLAEDVVVAWHRGDLGRGCRLRR